MKLNEQLTTVAVLDPNQANRVITSTGQIQRAAALVAYGLAYGNPSNGFIMYEAGHRQTGGTAPEYLSAQRAYFNFLVYQGILHAPNLN